jgi:hypothetical protein
MTRFRQKGGISDIIFRVLPLSDVTRGFQAHPYQLRYSLSADSPFIIAKALQQYIDTMVHRGILSWPYDCCLMMQQWRGICRRDLFLNGVDRLSRG